MSKDDTGDLLDAADSDDFVVLTENDKGVGTGPAGPVLAGSLFNSLAYMVKQNCMFEKSRQ